MPSPWLVHTRGFEMRGNGKTSAGILRTIANALECPNHWFKFVDHEGVTYTKEFAESFASGIRNSCDNNCLTHMYVDIRGGLPCLMYDHASQLAVVVDSERSEPLNAK